MKKLVIGLITVTLIFLMLFSVSFSALGADSTEKIQLGESSTYYSFDASTGTLIISGAGAVPDYSTTSQPWYTFRASIKSVIIEEGITAIGNNMFRQATALADISFPSTLTAIKDHAFYNATSLQSVRFPASISKIGNYSFFSCTSLATLYFDNMSAKLNLGVGVFIGCTKLLSAQFPTYTTFGQDSVGFKDEAGTLQANFVLHGINATTAMYYANSNGITFVDSLNLEFGTTFGYNFLNNKTAHLYSYAPTATGSYHFYSYGSSDIKVTLYNSTMSSVLASSDDRSMYDLNFDLTCTLTAGQTYYFKVEYVPNSDLTKEYSAYLYPSEITSITATLPEDFLLYEDIDGEVRTNSQGLSYLYYDMTQHYKDVSITVTYKTGYIDTFMYHTNDYNGCDKTFSLSDNQKNNHWQGGTNYMSLAYDSKTYLIPVNIHAHTYSMTRTEPTCTEDGSEIYVCACGKSYTVVIDALGHLEWTYFDVRPNCTEPGYYYYYCERCNEQMTATKIFYPIGHYFLLEVLSPTLTQGGYTTYTCRNCGYSYVGNFKDPTGHLVMGRLVMMEDDAGAHLNNIPIKSVSLYAKSYSARYITDENGYFSFYIGNGEYELYLDNQFGPGRSVELNVNGEDVCLGVIALVVFDFNGDGYINVRDYSLYMRCCNGLTSEDDDYSAELDFNSDGVLDHRDLELMKNFYGTDKKIDESFYD